MDVSSIASNAYSTLVAGTQPSVRNAGTGESGQTLSFQQTQQSRQTQQAEQSRQNQEARNSQSVEENEASVEARRETERTRSTINDNGQEVGTLINTTA